MADYLKSQVNNLIDVFDNADLNDLKDFAINLEANIDTTEILNTINDLDKMNSQLEFDNIEDEEYNINYFDTPKKNKIKNIVNEKKKKFKKNKKKKNKKQKIKIHKKKNQKKKNPQRKLQKKKQLIKRNKTIPIQNK